MAPTPMRVRICGRSAQPACATAASHGGRRPAALALMLMLMAGACASAPPPPPTPEAALVAFTRALEQGEFGQAYAMMAPSYRERVPYAQFERELRENPQERLEVSRALGHTQGPARTEARLVYGNEQELRFERHGERWLIATNVVDFYDQSTPRAALKAFLGAMRRQRYDVVMRLVPEGDKEGITPERMHEAWSGEAREDVERMLQTLQEHVDDPIEIVGDHATMPYGNHRVLFVREDGLWKIEAPE